MIRGRSSPLSFVFSSFFSKRGNPRVLDKQRATKESLEDFSRSNCERSATMEKWLERKLRLISNEFSSLLKINVSLSRRQIEMSLFQSRLNCH